MKRQCRYNELLAVYRDLGVAARSSVDMHLRECPACTARLAGYERTEQSLRALPELHLPTRLHQPWQLMPREPAASERSLRTGFGFVAGRVLLPAGLIIGLVIGVWFLLTSLTGGDQHMTATPTLTLTPTATMVTFLDEARAVAHVEAGVIPAPHAAALPPAPQPTLIAAQVDATGVLSAP